MEQPGELSQVQLAELKKAFAICDKDGNGVLEPAELKEVITLITDEEPSFDELQKLMLVVDKDGNGKIEWAEFLAAMTGWLQDDFKTKATAGGKRKSHPEQERQDVHKKIKSFFTQFKTDQASQIERIRREIQEGTLSMEVDDAASDSFMDVEGRRFTHWSSEAKLRFLHEYRVTLGNIDSIVHSLTDPFKQLEAITCIAKLLSIVEVFNTPTERRAVADDIVRIYETVVRSNLVPLLLKLTEPDNAPQVQWEALRSVTYFAPGPRIASTPEDSLLHPNQMFFKRLLIQENVIQRCLVLLGSPFQPVREQAVVCIGGIAAHNPETRDFTLQLNVVTPLVNLITTHTPLSMLRKVSWTLSILCGVTHPLHQLPPWDYISPALQPLSSLLFVDDEEVLCTISPALSLILPGVPEMIISRRLVELLKHKSPRVQKGILRMITNIIKFDNIQTSLLLHQCSMLSVVYLLLRGSGDSGVKDEVADLCLVLAGLKGEIQALITTQLVVQMIEFVRSDESLRVKFAKVLKYVTRGSALQIRYCVEQQLIPVLCKSLTTFKSYDSVITKAYKYFAPTYNFEFGRDVLVALDNVVNVGEMESDHHTAVNMYAMQFDMEAIDRLTAVLAAIKENPNKEEVDKWRLERPGDSSLEEKVKILLLKIRRAHQANEQLHPSSRHMAQMINDMLIKYFAPAATTNNNTNNNNNNNNGEQQRVDQLMTPTTFLVKVSLGADDIRVLTVPQNVTVEDFINAIKYKYNMPELKITYQDEEGDNITIDNQATLQKAFKRYENSPSVKVLIQAPSPSRSSLPSTATAAATTNNNNDNSSNTATTTTPALPPPPAFMSPNFSRLKRMPTIALIDGERQPKKIMEIAVNSGNSSSASSGDNNAKVVPKKVLFPDPPVVPKNLNFNLEHIKQQEIGNMFSALGTATHFGTKELQTLYERWKAQGSANGEVNREVFANGLKAIGITDPLIIELHFSAFDKDKNGTIDFREFVTGLSVVQRGTLEERLQFMFRAYDLDGNGVLSPSEMYNLYKATTSSKGLKFSEESLMQLVNNCFKEVDKNHDGVISYEEFKQAVESQTLIADCFVNIVA